MLNGISISAKGHQACSVGNLQPARQRKHVLAGRSSCDPFVLTRAGYAAKAFSSSAFYPPQSSYLSHIVRAIISLVLHTARTLSQSRLWAMKTPDPFMPYFARRAVNVVLGSPFRFARGCCRYSLQETSQGINREDSFTSFHPI